jgi:hypothetical protein
MSQVWILGLLLFSQIGNGQCQHCIKRNPQSSSIVIRLCEAPVRIPVRKGATREPKHVAGEDNKSKVDWAYSLVDLVFLANQEEGLFADVVNYKRSLERKLRTVEG